MATDIDSMQSSLMALLNWSQAQQEVDDENIAKNKAIKFKQTLKDELLVYGFINIYYALTIPNGIVQIILDFYLSLLSINNYKNIENKSFLWPFSNKSDVDLYLNAKHNDVITSCAFCINECIFYFECTPKGWGRWLNEESTIWCALIDLPQHISKIKVYFELKCTEVSFVGQETKILTTQENADNGGVWSMAPPKMIKFELFEGLDSFTFECYVKILEVYDKLGVEMVTTKEKLKRIISEESQKDKRSKLEIIRQLQNELVELKRDEENQSIYINTVGMQGVFNEKDDKHVQI